MTDVLMVAGGTGGHVYPALATAVVLRDRGHDVRFVGGDRIETRLVPEHGFELDVVASVGVPRASGAFTMVGRALSSAATLARAVPAARRIIRRTRPDVVLAMGGHTSLAPSWAAVLSRVPLVLHEQNAKLSLSHRLSVRWAAALATSLPLADRASRAATTTGNPLRSALRRIATDPAARADARRRALDRFALSPERLTVLSFGGSLGARPLNVALPEAVPAAGVQVIHVCGPDHADESRQLWAASGVAHAVEPYLDDIEVAYAAADVFVGRAGASTVAELTALGLPSVLVPLPHASPPGVQLANARVLADAGAALVVQQGERFADRLAEALAELCGSAHVRSAMTAAAAALGRADAAEALADLVLDAAR